MDDFYRVVERKRIDGDGVWRFGSIYSSHATHDDAIEAVRKANAKFSTEHRYFTVVLPKESI